MQINTKYTNLDSTPAIEEYVKDKIGGLEKLIKRLDEKGVAKAYVEIGRSTMHHQKGDVYHIECNLELPGKLLRGETENSDVRLGVDEVRNILDREIKKYGEKFRPQDSRGQAELRKLRGKE